MTQTSTRADSAARTFHPAVIVNATLPAATKRAAATIAPKQSVDATTLARIAGLRRTDPELSKLYQRFLAAVAKVRQADTPETQKGSVNEGTTEQKRLHALWERRLDAADAIFFEILRAPARTIEGMLLKIHVRGWTNEVPGQGYTPVLGAPDWTPGKPGYDDDADLLHSLRSDLRRITPKPDKLADQLEHEIIHYAAAFMEWGPITIAANRTLDARFPNWHFAAGDRNQYKKAMALRKKLVDPSTPHERALNRASDRIDRLVEKIAKRGHRDDMRARTLVVLHEMWPISFDHEGSLSFPDDGGATRALFDVAAEQTGLTAFVRYIERDLAKNARLIAEQKRAERQRAKKGGSK